MANEERSIYVSQSGEGLKVGYEPVKNSLGTLELKKLTEDDRFVLQSILSKNKGKRVLNIIAQAGFDLWGESLG